MLHLQCYTRSSDVAEQQWGITASRHACQNLLVRMSYSAFNLEFARPVCGYPVGYNIHGSSGILLCARLPTCLPACLSVCHTGFHLGGVQMQKSRGPWSRR